MFDRSTSPLRPGEPISAREINRALAKFDDSCDIGGAGVTTSNEFGGLFVSPITQARINLRILSGSNPYAWEEVRQLDDGTWEANGGLEGTEDYQPAYERNGNTSVAADTVAEAVAAPATADGGSPRWLFSSPATSGGGGGGITAFDNGTESFPSAITPGTGPYTDATLYAFPTTGISLGTNSGANGLMLRAASESQQGAVTTTAQTFDGVKTFQQGVLAGNTAFPGYDTGSASLSYLGVTIDDPPGGEGTTYYAGAASRSQTIHPYAYPIETPEYRFWMVGFAHGAYDIAPTLRHQVYETAGDGVSVRVLYVADLQVTVVADGGDKVAIANLVSSDAAVASDLSATNDTDRAAFAINGTLGKDGSVAGITSLGGIVTSIPAALTYSPTTPGDWAGSAPTTIKDALDRCAALLKTLNGGTGP